MTHSFAIDNYPMAGSAVLGVRLLSLLFLTSVSIYVFGRNTALCAEHVAKICGRRQVLNDLYLWGFM